MYNSIHYKFINTPLIDIIKDAVNACDGVGSGIETYPLCDYVFQSIFLRMTGAQEQKLKCICWELATNNFDYRYKYLNGVKNDYGEFSKYKHKNNVYTKLTEEISRNNPDFKIDEYEWYSEISSAIKKQCLHNEKKNLIRNEIEKQKKIGKKLEIKTIKEIIKNVTVIFNTHDNKKIFHKVEKEQFALNIKSKIHNLLKESTLSISNYHEYSFWKSDKKLSYDKFALSNDLLSNELKSLYDNDVIKHRHRCAHNLTSYQQNLPTLSTLSDSQYLFYNYFFRFYILILIDEIFMKLYQEYTKALDNTII